MRLLPLSEVRARLQPGLPLPWSVRDDQGKLLLARGHPVGSAAMIQALLERGVFVAEDEASVELLPPPPPPLKGSPFERWDQLCAQLTEVLRSPGERHFLQRVRDAVWHVRGLNELNADLLLFLILRHDHGRFETYGTAHALHVACVCSLMAKRLGWDVNDQERVIGAALTMNLSIIDLQGQLARQSAPLTRLQREQVAQHPHKASLMLRAAGLDDDLWLSAVEDHHERRGGGGYPASCRDPGAMSQLLRLADQFTAKHSARATRPALPAQLAARQLFLENPDDAVAAMMIKEFGIYPPGCFVRLASGELAIVVRRGASANAPQVAAITTARGERRPTPQPRDTAQSGFGIVGSIAEPPERIHIPPGALYPEALAA